MHRLKTFAELFHRERRPGDLVFALAFLGFSLFLAAHLGDQVKWVKRTGFFSQPAFWPTVAIAGMVFFAVLHILGSLVFGKGRATHFSEVVFWGRSLEYVAYFLIYVAIVHVLGYLPSTILFTLAITARLGYRRPLAFASALLFAVTVVIVFRAMLHVRIPPGQIYDYLPDAIRGFALIYL